MRIALLWLAATTACCTFPATAQYRPVEERLSEAEFQEAGLGKLSSTELAALNRLLREDAPPATEAPQVASTEETEDVEDAPVESRLVGPFKGWSKGTVLTLENGQRWQVTDGDLYLGRAEDSPAVSVKPGLFSGWYLQVEGQSPRAKVRLLD